MKEPLVQVVATRIVVPEHEPLLLSVHAGRRFASGYSSQRGASEAEEPSKSVCSHNCLGSSCLPW